MKKYILGFMMMLAMCVLTTACSSDDDDVVEVTAESLIGKWTASTSDQLGLTKTEGTYTFQKGNKYAIVVEQGAMGIMVPTYTENGNYAVKEGKITFKPTSGKSTTSEVKIKGNTLYIKDKLKNQGLDNKGFKKQAEEKKKK